MALEDHDAGGQDNGQAHDDGRGRDEREVEGVEVGGRAQKAQVHGAVDDKGGQGQQGLGAQAHEQDDGDNGDERDGGRDGHGQLICADDGIDSLGALGRKAHGQATVVDGALDDAGVGLGKAADRDLAAFDLRRNRGRYLDGAVQDNGQLAGVFGQLAGDVGEGLGALVVEGKAQDVAALGRGGLGDRRGRDVGAVHEGGVGAVLELDVLGAGVELGQGLGVGDVVAAHELDVARLREGLDGRGVVVGRAGELNGDVGAVLGHRGKVDAQGGKTRAQDLRRAVHLAVAGGLAVGGGGKGRAGAAGEVDATRDVARHQGKRNGRGNDQSGRDAHACAGAAHDQGCGAAALRALLGCFIALFAGRGASVVRFFTPTVNAGLLDGVLLFLSHVKPLVSRDCLRA